MKAVRFLILLLSILASTARAENGMLDSLKQCLVKATADSVQVRLLHELSYGYLWTNSDSALWYAEHELSLARSSGDSRYEAMALIDISNSIGTIGNDKGALKNAFEALRIAEKYDDRPLISRCYNSIANTQSELKNFEEAIRYHHKSKAINEQLKDSVRLTHDLINLGIVYYSMESLDSSLHYVQKAYQLALSVGTWNYDMVGSILRSLGEIQAKLGNDEIALAYLEKAVESSIRYEDWVDYHEANFDIGTIFKAEGKRDSCLKYFHRAYDGALRLEYVRGMIKSLNELVAHYRGTDPDSTLKYLELVSVLKDSLNNEEQLRATNNMTYAENAYQQQREQERAAEQQERKENLQMSGITLFILTLFVFFVVLTRFRANPKLISHLGLVSLLLLFEFISLLLHPFIAHITDHSPVLMLLALAVIAATLAPLHKRIEKWIEERVGKK